MKEQHNIPNWNKDGVWKKVEERLYQKKKKRRFLWWWIFGGTATVLLVGSIFLYTYRIDEDYYESKKSAVSTDVIAHTPSDFVSEVIEQEKKEAVVSSKIKEEHTAPNIVAPSQQRSQLVIKHKQNYTTTYSPDIVFEKSIPVKRDDIQTPKTSSSGKITNEALNTEADEVRILIDHMLTTNLPLSSLDSVKLDPQPEYIMRSIDVLTLERTKVLLWVETGIDFGNRFFMNPNDKSNERASTEQFRLRQTNAFGLQWFFHSSAFVKTGLAYQTIYERYENETTSTSIEDIPVDNAIVYNLPNGIQYQEPGTLSTTTTKNRLIAHNNFLHRLSIPIELGFAYKFGDWSLEPTLGFRVQFFQQFDGVITFNNEHLFDLDRINETYYANDFGIGVIGSLQLKYHLGSRSKFGMRINYEQDDVFDLNTTNSFAKYETIGLHLGYYHAF